VLTSTFAFAQTTQTTSTAGQADADRTPITLVGCLQREADYRRAQDAGRGGIAATGAGLGNEFVLIQASRTGAEPDCKSSTALAGEAYELTGEKERDLAQFAGRRVEITGMLKRADTETQAVGTSGAGRPTGGFDPLGQDLRLHEVNVGSFREVAMTAQASGSAQAGSPASGTTSQPEQTGTVASAGSELPRTASPLALAGLIGLLSLGGALGVRFARG
jgi:hypothetical protein